MLTGTFFFNLLCQKVVPILGDNLGFKISMPVEIHNSGFFCFFLNIFLTSLLVFCKFGVAKILS